MNFNEWGSRFPDLSCTVIGLGISNLPLIGFLLRHGVPVTARDRKNREELGETAARMDAMGVPLILGEHYLDGLTEPVIFRSPGLRPDVPELCEAVRRGAVLTSEMELFFDLTPARRIGVTGSDGKTTTTTLTSLLLKEELRRTGGAGRVYVGGNIGTPLLPLVEEMTPDDFAVTELSSFQLQTMKRSPERAAITNVSPNHLNWHTGMEEYIEAKTHVFSGEGNRLLVLNAENDVTRGLSARRGGRVTWFSSAKHSFAEFSDLCLAGDRAVWEEDGWIRMGDGTGSVPMLEAGKILLPGRHNLENYMTALALTEGLISPEAAEAVATTFCGVPHRLERIRTVGGVTYYNSSIDSSPTRTAAALSALREKPIVICGGYDKHLSYVPLAEALCRRAKAVVLTGATAGKIREALEPFPEVAGGKLPVLEAKTFTEAVLLAKNTAHPGDTVLLSPACASFDAFRNFEERGDTFRRLVENFTE